MQCSCGSHTRTHYYQKKVVGKPLLKITSQEICVTCGRATQLKLYGYQSKPGVQRERN